MAADPVSPPRDGRAERGRLAETLAVAALERAGLRVVDRNWRTPEAELDLVAVAPDGTCVFCEVRSRSGEERGDPLETIGARKQARIIRAARLYLAAGAPAVPHATAYRFDVVGVTFFGDDHPPRVVHIPAAFEVPS